MYVVLNELMQVVRAEDIQALRVCALACHVKSFNTRGAVDNFRPTLLLFRAPCFARHSFSHQQICLETGQTPSLMGNMVFLTV